MKHYIIGIAITLFCFSCQLEKDLFGNRYEGKDIEVLDGYGLLDLQLLFEKETDIPDSWTYQTTKSDEESLDVENFAVVIKDETNKIVKEFESYAKIKTEEGVLLPEGTYTIHAYWGYDQNAAFDEPYYSGSQTCVIVSGEVTKLSIGCDLSNKRIVFRFTDNFFDRFEKDYTIVIDNGSGVLVTKNNESRKAYLKDTGILQFMIYVRDKNTHQLYNYFYDLSKNEQIENHNNIVVDLDIEEPVPNDPEDPTQPENPTDPEEPEDPGDPVIPVVPGTMQVPTIRVDITLVEKEYVIEIPSDFVDAGDLDINGGNTGGNTGGSTGGDTPTIDPSTIKPTITGTIGGKTFDINKPQTFSTSTSSIVINLYLPTGLAGLDVIVQVGSIGPIPFDLANTDDVNAINNLLAGSGKKLVVPAKGEKGNLKFDITAFLDLLMAADGDSSFVITVKDANGKSEEKKLTLIKE